jgi:hypothetical protein
VAKSKFGGSNLYMTTREFSDLVIQTLHEQNYFRHNDVAHPQDIAHAFTTVGETIGNAMSWAIKQESDLNKKNAVMQTGNLRKNALPQDEEIAPQESGYSEWKFKK